MKARKDSKWQEHFEWVYGKRPREELYDLAKDPQQTRNVATEPEYQEIRVQLEKRLLATLKETGDPRVINEGQYFETPPLTGPVEEPKNAARGN